jgi:hypothetical protein
MARNCDICNKPLGKQVMTFTKDGKQVMYHTDCWKKEYGV